METETQTKEAAIYTVDLAYYLAYQIITEIDAKLQAGHWYRDTDGYRLETLDEILHAILADRWPPSNQPEPTLPPPGHPGHNGRTRRATIRAARRRPI